MKRRSVPLPSPAHLRALFGYRDGMLYWREDYRDARGYRRARAGDAVFTRPAGTDKAYLYASVEGDSFGLHRLIFAWHHGYYPPMVDHDDRNKRHNEIGNLKPSNGNLNMANRGATKVSKTGIKNVFLAESGKLRVKVARNKKQYWGGSFDDLGCAAEAAAALEKAVSP